MISTKTKPLPPVVEACYPLLKLVTHDEFKSTLLPALQKSMLRNPEVILECVGVVIKGMNLDLSQYAMDLGKSLTCKYTSVIFHCSISTALALIIHLLHFLLQQIYIQKTI